MINIYEIDDDHIEHTENVFLYIKIDYHHDMFHEYKQSNNHNHSVIPPFQYK